MPGSIGIDKSKSPAVFFIDIHGRRVVEHGISADDVDSVESMVHALLQDAVNSGEELQRERRARCALERALVRTDELYESAKATTRSFQDTFTSTLNWARDQRDRHLANEEEWKRQAEAAPPGRVKGSGKEWFLDMAIRSFGKATVLQRVINHMEGRHEDQDGE